MAACRNAFTAGDCSVFHSETVQHFTGLIRLNEDNWSSASCRSRNGILVQVQSDAALADRHGHFRQILAQNDGLAVLRFVQGALEVSILLNSSLPHNVRNAVITDVRIFVPAGLRFRRRDGHGVVSTESTIKIVDRGLALFNAGHSGLPGLVLIRLQLDNVLTGRHGPFRRHFLAGEIALEGLGLADGQRQTADRLLRVRLFRGHVLEHAGVQGDGGKIFIVRDGASAGTHKLDGPVWFQIIPSGNEEIDGLILMDR